MRDGRHRHQAEEHREPRSVGRGDDRDPSADVDGEVLIILSNWLELLIPAQNMF